MTITMGAYSYWSNEVNPQYNRSNVRIGKYCSIANNVVMDTGMQLHTDWATTSSLNFHFYKRLTDGYSRGDIEIGNDVWIGEGALIMSGVHIADGGVVGARAVVTHDIPPYAIVGGVPARVIRYRFPDNVIKRFLMLKWWDWPYEKVKERMPLLLSPDYEVLFKTEGPSTTPD